MMRITLAIALGFAVISLASVAPTVAQEKKKGEKKTLEGTLTCTKCALKETKACGHALLVKEGDKEVKYYISDKGGKEAYHKHCCTADVPAKVTGIVSEKNGKKTISNAKVEIKK